MILFAILLYAMGYIGGGIIRIAMYYSWVITLFIPEILAAINNKTTRYTVYLFIYVILFLQYLYFGPGSTLIPYKFYWQ